MENVNKNYNQLSDQLKAELKKAMPKPGQVIWFESIRPKSRGTTIMGFDRIWDPGANNGEGDYVDIAYLPSVNADPKKSRITFSYANKGRIGIHGGNKADEQRFAFLYFTNVLGNNVGKPWYIQPVGGVMCNMQEPSQTAKDKNEFRRKVRVAGERIDETPDSKLFDFAIGLDMKTINKHSDPEEIRDQLYKIAEKNPDKVLSLDKDLQFQVKIMIKNAEKYGVIARDQALGQLIWPDTKEVICTIPPGTNTYESLVKYFLGKGQEVYRSIVGLTERKMEGEKITDTDQGKDQDQPPAPPKNKGGRPRKVVADAVA